MGGVRGTAPIPDICSQQFQGCGYGIQIPRALYKPLPERRHGPIAFVVFCFGAYHEFMFKGGWRREWLEGHGRWGLFNYNIPEPHRTHRRRSNQMALLFLAVGALWCLVIYIRYHAYPS